ncbi:MAG: hypothetical protein U1F09_14575 [Steroidobacteraceae bacterium]
MTIVAAGIGVFLTGCAHEPTYVATVSGDSAAVVRVPMHFSMSLTSLGKSIDRIDGLPIPAAQRPQGPVRVDPGERTVQVSGTWCCRPVGHGFHGGTTLQANLQPGHSYALRAEFDAGTMTFWLEDESSHETAGERRSTDTEAVTVSGLQLPAFH